MLWAIAVAYLVLLSAGILFLRAAGKADERVARLEGHPNCADQMTPAPGKAKGAAPLRKACGV